MSVNRGYTILTVRMAAQFTLALSCIAPNNLLLSTLSVTDSILISSLASSSLLTLFVKTLDEQGAVSQSTHQQISLQ